MDSWVQMTYVMTQRILERLSQLKDVRSNKIRQTLLVWLRLVGLIEARKLRLKSSVMT